MYICTHIAYVWFISAEKSEREIRELRKNHLRLKEERKKIEK